MKRRKERKKNVRIRKRNNYEPRHIRSDHENGAQNEIVAILSETRDALRKSKKKESKCMRNATEGLCSAATYYLLKGVCDETDRFNSHHVVSHAYNYPLSIYSNAMVSSSVFLSLLLIFLSCTFYTISNTWLEWSCRVLSSCADFTICR